MTGQKLTSSREDYLEAILSLIHDKGFARVRDIAEQLGVGRSAVSNALTALAKADLVVYEPYRMVTLTDKGTDAAQAVTDRHDTLKQFMESVLGLAGDRADDAACSFEHDIDPLVLERLTQLTAFFARKRGGKSLTDRWEQFYTEIDASPEGTDA
jgi:DtxR family transcriptional regulator, Mn-dependent transcriptional regulator